MVNGQTMTTRAVLGALVVALMLGGCAAGMGGRDYARADARRTMVVQFGTVAGVRGVNLEGTKTPIGTVTGAAVGGIAGSTIGSGKGSAVGAVLGAVVGGMTGAAVEEGATRKVGVEVTVRMDDGQYLAVVQADEGENFRVGERVRILRDAGETRVAR